METVVGLKGFEPLWLPAKPRSGVNQMRDKAVENVWRDYERIVLMPLVGAKIGLALMFEDLVKQGVVKKYCVRTGESVRFE